MNTLEAAPTSRPVRWVGTCWVLLLVNVLGFIGGPLLPIPKAIGQLVTMGSLGMAFVIAIVHNPRMQIRPNALLTLTSALVLTSVVSSLRLEAGPAAPIRAGRYVVFVSVLWLLTPYWRDGMQFVRYHLRALWAVLATVLLGLAIAPGFAMGGGGGGRLRGSLWPIPPPQVGQYAAIAVGLTFLLYTHRMIGGAAAWVAIPLATATLLLTQTRTALAGLAIGLLVALLSQFLVSARARRILVLAVGLGGLGAAALSPLIVSWLSRGQDAEGLSNLTGRTKVWTALLAQPRGHLDHWFGIGLSDKSYNGLPIDSTWLAAYHEQGLIGAVLVAVIYAMALLGAAVRPPSAARSCALFLVTYLVVASYTEVGVGDSSPYLLHLCVAAAALHGADGDQRRGAAPKLPIVGSRVPG